MKRAILFIVGAIATWTPALPASAKPLFYAEASPSTVTIYSSSDKAMRCVLRIEFLFTRKERFRSVGLTQCSKAAEVKPGKHQKVCSFSHPALVDPAIAGPVQVLACDPIP